MSATSGRERVVRRYDPRGVMCLAFLWGVVIRDVLIPLGEYIDQWIPPQFPMATIVILVHLLVLSFAVGPLMLARVTSQGHLQLVCAVMVVLGLYAAELADRFLSSLGKGTLWGWTDVGVADVVTLVVYWAAASAIAFIVRWLYRAIRSQPIEQTDPPQLCYACGYEAGVADPCPECGICWKDARPRGVVLDSIWKWLQRSGRLALAIVLLLFSVYAGYRIATEYVSTRGFLARFGEGFRPVNAMHELAYAADPNDPTAWRCNGRVFPLDGESGRMILVTYLARTRRSVPVMHVRICAPATAPPGWSGRIEDWTDWGAGTVVADLDRDQAERVIRDGLPRGLIDAIVAKAAKTGWKPSGGIHNSVGLRITVDPTPYFEDDAATNDD